MSTIQKTLGRTPEFTVGVIGSAGRKGDANKMTRELYCQMLSKLETVITTELGLDLSKAHLVSGGAAWADHLAVTMFLKDRIAGLTLHLPAPWKGGTDPHFQDNQTKNNPGQMANKYHEQFTKKIGENTLQQIDLAKLTGAIFNHHQGFKERNCAVAKDSNYLVAFTWHDQDTPKPGGGTADTWAKHKCKGKERRKVHVPLSSLVQKSNGGGSSGVSSSMVHTPSTGSLSSQSQSDYGDSVPPTESELMDMSPPTTSPEVTSSTTKQHQEHTMESNSSSKCVSSGDTTSTTNSMLGKRGRGGCSIQVLDTKRQRT